jgi:pilus assembly protein CpaB
MRLTRGLVLLLALSSAAGAATLVHRITRIPVRPAEIAKPDLVEILVAARAIAIGDMVGREEVRWQPWPRAAIPAGSFHREPGASAGGLPFEPAPARFFLLEGDPLSAAKLIQPERGGTLASLLAPDMRAISVPIREETAAGGFVQPNDRVDVIVTRKASDAGQERPKSEILVRGAKVLAIGKMLSGGKAAGGGKTATLELTPNQARRLTAAQAAGEISLALIGAADFANGDFPTASIAEPASEIRMLKYGRSSQQKTLE